MGRVCGDEVEDDLQPSRVRFANERVHRCEVAEHRVDIGVVADVVATVVLRRRVERRQPDGIDAQPLQIIEPGGDAGQIAEPA